MFVRVTFPISRFQTFTYSVPSNLHSKIQPGSCVQTPMGKRTLIGYVLSIDDKSIYNGKVKDILNIHESDLNLPQDLWNTLEWMSKYYITPMGQVLKSAIPQSFMEAYSPQLVKYVQITPEGELALESWDSNAHAQHEFLLALSQIDEPIRLSSMSEIVSSPHSISRVLENKGFIKTAQQAKVYDPFDMMVPGEAQEITLSPAQNAVFKPIKKELNNGKYSPFLLHGVTGSGKTEVYLKLAQEVVNNGGTVLVLVPEISLTPQVAKRFRRAFGAGVALWHSKMTKAEKGWTWQQLKKGNYTVVVGARSAMFAPLNNLQLIIVDEEQESSYKQESPSPRYHARDVALIRGKYANATVLLTSATPSLESHYNSIKKKLSHLKLSERFGESAYPKVKLVDMKNESTFGEEAPILSDILKEEIEHCLKNNEQIILLQNRRGFSLIQQCEECGCISTCNQCAVSLTYHRTQQKLICHYCKFESPILHTCGECKGDSLQLKGSGTQHVEEVIRETFPNTNVLRMDVDTVQKRGAHHKILQQFEDGKADILLGTQMIAKGLDFPNVTLVGIINADSGLFLPDFRAGERTFQLLYQVCGRAGRHTKPGKAVIQTYNPQDPYIQSAAQLNIQKFYSIALAQRQELAYPPFSRISRILISGKNQNNVNSISSQLSAKLHLNNMDFQILGPVPAPIERIRENWRNHIIIKSTASSASKIHTFIYNVLGINIFEGVQKGVRVQIDMDPVSML